MKKITACFLLFFAGIAFAQKKQSVDLDWKIAKGETISYTTVMKPIEQDSARSPMSNFLKKFIPDSTLTEKPNIGKLLNELNKSTQNDNYVTRLSLQNNDVVDIIMEAVENENDTADIQIDSLNGGIMKLIHELNGGILLRGAVYKSGGIQSFWLSNRQKNIVALLFQLPEKPVQVGDSWGIDVNYLTSDQNYQWTESRKVNKVTLTELKKVKGETIAVIKYSLEEYLGGMGSMPLLGGDPERTTMRFTFEATAEFSVDKGRWINYNGILAYEATGFMEGKQKQAFALFKN